MSHCVTYTDGRGRAWTIADLTSIGEFGRVVPVGDERTCYRRFTHQTLIRHYALRPGEDPRDILPDRLHAQLRSSFGDGDRLRSSAERIQDLYANHRGMGPR